MGVIVTMATEAGHTRATFVIWAKFHKIKFLHVAGMVQLLSSYENLDGCSSPVQNYASFNITYFKSIYFSLNLHFRV